MAGDGQTTYSVTSETAQRLAKPISGAGPTRRIISKELVYAPEHGRLTYTVPGMANFIRHQETG